MGSQPEQKPQLDPSLPSDETQLLPTTKPNQVDYTGVLLSGRYRIVKKLGSGGFATVYEAQDGNVLSKKVVVKVLHTTNLDEWQLRKFRQEKEALARIDHPGVVAILDEGRTPEDTPYLVMQYVSGDTLKSVVKPGGMPLMRAGEIFQQIGSALQAAHEAGVFHRDLKPENIMLQSTPTGDRVRLIDFGIAGIAESVYGSANQSTRVAGTVSYMPPEQLEGEVSAQTDIYSFGALAFELLAGELAVKSPLQLVTLPGGTLGSRLRELRPDIPEAAAQIVLKALSADPKQRYATAREMGDGLKEALRVTEVPQRAPMVLDAIETPPGLATSPGSQTPRPGTERPPATGTSRPPSDRLPPSDKLPPSDQLEIAHVLFLDIVAYSTLSMGDQRAILQKLQDLVRQTHLKEADGRHDLVALPTGDGMALVFFGDPTSAADCALEISRALREQPALKLRMGLHTGPVYRVNDINKNLNVSGGGINLAQRVMDAGDAGHILLSSGMADVLAQVGGWKGWLQDLGQHPVKHGVAMHFYNLHTGEVGNAAWPSKWERPSTAKTGANRRGLVAAIAIALVLGGAAWFVYPKIIGTRDVKPPVEQTNTAPPAAKLHLEFFALVQKAKDGKPVGQPVPYADAAVLPEGYGIALNFSSPEAGYLYILNQGPLEDGTKRTTSINVLYPGYQESARVGAGQSVRIPKAEWLVLDQASGTEDLYLAWSSKAVPELEQAKDQADALTKDGIVIRADRAQEQYAAILQLLKKYKVPKSQIQVSDTKTGLTSGEDVLVHLIQLKHL